MDRTDPTDEHQDDEDDVRIQTRDFKRIAVVPLTPDDPTPGFRHRSGFSTIVLGHDAIFLDHDLLVHACRASTAVEVRLCRVSCVSGDLSGTGLEGSVACAEPVGVEVSTRLLRPVGRDQRRRKTAVSTPSGHARTVSAADPVS